MPAHVMRALAAILFLALGLVTLRVGVAWWQHRQWQSLRARQLAAIEQLGQFPPPGCSVGNWQNALISPSNVWGNVIVEPEASEIGTAAMQELLAELETIVAETNPQNSLASVDRVFELLQRRGRKTQFIAGYREEFRALGFSLQAAGS